MSYNKSYNSRGNELQVQSSCSVYFYGGCPLCNREIAIYRQMRGAEAINWIDASRCDASLLSAGLSRSLALQRLHVMSTDGTLFSGAAAFVEVWKQMPAFAWMARLCSNRYVLAILDFPYERFLVARRLWRKA